MCATPIPTNADTVGSLYAAFRAHHIAYILDHLDDDVAWDADWTSNSAQQAGVAHLRARRGLVEVADFFAMLADWEFEDFTILDIIGTGRQIAAEVHIAAVLPHGGRIVDQELHLWTFDEEGRVTRFRHYSDTAKHIAAADRSEANSSRYKKAEAESECCQIGRSTWWRTAIGQITRS